MTKHAAAIPPSPSGDGGAGALCCVAPPDRCEGIGLGAASCIGTGGARHASAPNTQTGCQVARYFVTPHARDGLREVVGYVEQHFGDRVAQQVLDRLLGAFATLAESPNLGHRREDITRDERVRFWSVGPSLIAYRPRTDGRIEILFVERGERDWERLWEAAE